MSVFLPKHLYANQMAVPDPLQQTYTVVGREYQSNPVAINTVPPVYNAFYGWWQPQVDWDYSMANVSYDVPASLYTLRVNTGQSGLTQPNPIYNMIRVPSSSQLG